MASAQGLGPGDAVVLRREGQVGSTASEERQSSLSPRAWRVGNVLWGQEDFDLGVGLADPARAEGAWELLAGALADDDHEVTDLSLGALDQVIVAAVEGIELAYGHAEGHAAIASEPGSRARGAPPSR